MGHKEKPPSIWNSKTRRKKPVDMGFSAQAGEVPGNSLPLNADKLFDDLRLAAQEPQGGRIRKNSGRKHV